MNLRAIWNTETSPNTAFLSHFADWSNKSPDILSNNKNRRRVLQGIFINLDNTRFQISKIQKLFSSSQNSAQEISKKGFAAWNFVQTVRPASVSNIGKDRKELLRQRKESVLSHIYIKTKKDGKHEFFNTMYSHRLYKITVKFFIEPTYNWLSLSCLTELC